MNKNRRILQCPHCLTGSGGKIGGFSAGLSAKRQLLALEAIKMK